MGRVWVVVVLGMALGGYAQAQNATAPLFAKVDTFCERREPEGPGRERCRADQSVAVTRLMLLLDQPDAGRKAVMRRLLTECMAETQVAGLPDFVATVACIDPQRLIIERLGKPR